MDSNLSINGQRLIQSIFDLGKIGALEGGGVSRLALSKEDGEARSFLIKRMKDLEMSIKIDAVGNIIAINPGEEDLAPVLMGSHIDTVAAAGLYDGCFGVLAAIEVIATLKNMGIKFKRPLGVGIFTNEEGVRFQPYMLGSLYFVGGASLEQTLETKDLNGITVAEALKNIGYAGTDKIKGTDIHSFLEIHIEQGPVLDKNKIQIGVVEGVQGATWSEINLLGKANHAGTTPMSMRHDAGYVAAKIMTYAYEMANRIGQNTRATVGRVSSFNPGMVNVIPEKVTFTVDVRNYNEEIRKEAEAELWAYAEKIAKENKVSYERKPLAIFQTTEFSDKIIKLIREKAEDLNLSHKTLPSGAGHDAQMMAKVCPTGMIFVPNKDGLSHNIEEHAEPENLTAGTNVLLAVAVSLAKEE